MYGLLAPWFVYRALFKGKRCGNWRQRFLGLAPQRASRQNLQSAQTKVIRVWFHAVSVGEVNLLAPVILELKKQRAELEILISTTTRTGFELAGKKYPELTRFYAPIDFVWAVKNALRRVQPDLVVLSELELWPNLIGETTCSNIPLAVINGRLGDKSFRGYQKLAGFFRKVLQKVSLVCSQDAETSARFKQLGVPAERIQTTGSIKFDGVKLVPSVERTEELRRLAAVEPGELVWVAGSTQADEEEMVGRIYLRLRAQIPGLRLILVPRHIERSGRIAGQLESLGLETSLRTQLIQDGHGDRGKPDVVLVNVIGELFDWWSLADVAFVGGSFGNRGGQNMIEPAALGVATCFGPNTWNFRQVVKMMLAADAACQVNSESELESFVRRCLQDTGWSNAMAARAQLLVSEQQGGALRTAQQLLKLLDGNSAYSRAA